MRVKELFEKVERLYHGSEMDFDEFSPNRVGDRLVSLGLGHYLTPDPNLASDYGTVMQFDVKTDNFLDWDNLTPQDRERVEGALLKVIPPERIAGFGEKKYEVLPANKEGAARFKELKQMTKDAYHDMAKARVLDDDDIPDEILNKITDEIVVGWREGGNLRNANPQQLMTLMNEYYPELARNLGYNGSRFSKQVAIYDPKLAKRVK